MVSARAGDSVITLRNAIAGRIVSVSQTIAISPDQHFLTLSCEARAFDVVNVAGVWSTARVALYPLTAENRPRYDVPHLLVALEGTRSWRTYEKVFRIPDENRSVSVQVQLANARGAIEVRALKLTRAMENSVFLTSRNLLRVLWILVGAWIVVPLVLSARRHFARIAVLILGLVLLAGILVPGDIKLGLTPTWLLPESETLMRFRYEYLPHAVPFDFGILTTDLDIYTLAHFLLFGGIGYLMLAFRPYRMPIRFQIGTIGLFALATEAAQTLATGRGGSFGDVLVDMAGVTVGMLVTRTRAVGSRTDSR
jgi:hypothetical protein